MKSIARWLFMKAYYSQLCDVAKYVKRDLGDPRLDPQERRERACEASGAIYALEKLNLLADK